MKNIVLSAIVAILLIGGAYHIALLAGASEPAAVAAFNFVAVVAFVFAVLVGAVAAVLVGAVAAVLVGTVAAVLVGTVAGSAVVAVAAVFTFAVLAVVIIAAFAAAVGAQEEHVRFRWVFGAYLLEVLALGGLLSVGNLGYLGWSVAIMLGGIAALFTLLHVHSRLSALDVLPAVSAVPEQNGA